MDRDPSGTHPDDRSNLYLTYPKPGLLSNIIQIGTDTEVNGIGDEVEVASDTVVQEGANGTVVQEVASGMVDDGMVVQEVASGIASGTVMEVEEVASGSSLRRSSRSFEQDVPAGQNSPRSRSRSPCPFEQIAAIVRAYAMDEIKNIRRAHGFES